jgi:hypothetical protein
MTDKEQIELLREALKFYADGEHFVIHDTMVWDTVSGEPQNLYEHDDNSATVEDGSIAKQAIAATELGAQEKTAAPKTDFGRAYKALQLMRNPHENSEHAHTWDMAIADALRAVHAAEVEAAIQKEKEGK